MTPPRGAERITYSSGELKLAAWISPPTKAKHSAVLFLHGGDVLGEGHWDLTEPYRKAGYAVMMPTLRGENGQAGAYSGFYDENADVLAAAAHFAALPHVDAARLFVAGHSMGGTQTLLAAMSSRLFRGAAAFSGSADARAFFAHFPEMIVFDPADPHEYDMRSAVSYAASFKCPIRIMHGSEETRQDAPSRLTAQRAKAAGIDAEAIIVQGDHFSALPGETRDSILFFGRL